ncbi:hypothetical protein BDN72DRAFT_791692 [Pluteus cervinus]|uniref:Uncharacterized protein n=1 Tax=Pluteus cervinus TaxID=181527 RepID=A0ACD3B4D9_9AGAR|nr:hypothetical protein BDN72DRAFT_791692 [Pluteus cervinus]
MLCKHRLAHHSRQLFRCRTHRFYSTTTPTYPFKNLRALPFALSANDAIVQMGPYASMVSMFTEIIGSLGARYLPGLGFEPFKPTRITPVYFPAWIIDAEVQANVTSTQEEETQSVCFLPPSSDFKALSSVSFWTKHAKHIEPVPFTKDLEHQFGADVISIPYNISPFTLLEVARSLSYADCTIEEDFRFNPSSVKTNLFAAYPILIPLYLAQYSFTPPGLERVYSLTVCMEAYSPGGRIFVERLGGEKGKLIRQQFPNAPAGFIRFTDGLDGPGMHNARGVPSSACNIPALMMANPPPMLALTLESWLEDALGDDSAMGKLASMSPAVSDDDPRIREYTHEETLNTRNWMALGAELWTMKSIIAALSRSGGSQKVYVFGAGDSMQAVDAMQKNEEKLREKRESLKPSWWKEWEDKAAS